MFKSLISMTLLMCIIASSLYGDCCQSVDVSVGWRRDFLDWKKNNLESSGILADVDSHFHFKDIQSYTISGTARWIDTAYSIRLSAEYGTTFKGRAEEIFEIKSPLLFCPIEIDVSNPIKRHSEVYDFNGAVGYPFTFCCSRLVVVPLVGFSFHRQNLRVQEDEHCCSCYYDSYYDTYGCDLCCSKSHHSFCICSDNLFIGSPSSNPFSESSSDDEVANALGLFTHHRTSSYRFTWYGFYLGTDIAYALDPCWTIYTELEYHFCDRAHRNRKSLTGVEFVDHYHKNGWAYGFNGVLGVTAYIGACWYTILAVDFKWWKADSKHDDLEWNMVGAKIGLGYSF